MTAEPHRKDLVLLVADKFMDVSLKGILGRCQSLGCRPVSFDLFVHPEHDPGCLRRSQDFLRLFVRSHQHALVVLDHDGCGEFEAERSGLESDLEGRLSAAGWDNRAAAVVISPELECWLWSDSPQVDLALGWQGRDVPLRDWLRKQGLLKAGAIKPSDPKRAVKLALRTVRKTYSAAIYFELAQSVSTERCTDPAFAKLKRTLREWFPSTPSAPQSHGQI